MGDVNLEVLDGALGIVPQTGDELHAVIGVSSAGLAGSIAYTSNPDKLVNAKGRGPGPQAACLNMLVTGKPLVFGKVAATTAGKVKDSDATPIAIASSTNATPIVVTSATPHKRKTGDVVTIAGHLVNTAANGTFRVIVLSSTTFSLVGTVGVGVGGATGTIQPTGMNAYQAAGTSVLTATGAAIDSQQFRWQWVKGGTRGASGASFRYSADGGNSWSAELQIGAATSYVIPDSGVTVAFSAGTWVAGDEWRFDTVEPLWAVADVVTMLDTLRATGYKFRLIELVGPMTASDAVSLTPMLDAMATKYRYTRLIGHARDFDPAIDTDADAWATTLAADVAALDTERIAIAAGYYRVTSVIDNRLYRRPALFPVVARIMARPIQEHPGKVRKSGGGGALRYTDSPSQAEIDSKNLDDMVYLDTSEDPTLKTARFITLRKRVGRPGWFVDEASTMASPASDYTTLPLCFVIDKASDLTYEWLVDILNDDPPVNEDTGHITEEYAQGEEARARSIFNNGMVAKRNCSAVTAQLMRDDEILSTKTLTAKTRVVPKGYVRDISVTVAFTNPALNIA